MNKIEALNQKLQNEPRLFIDVFDPLTQTYLDRNQTAVSILENHASIMEYYRSFYAKGHNEIGIISKRKNGTSYIGKQLPINVSFQANEEPIPDPQTPNQQTNRQSDNMPIEGLGGGKKELSIDDYINLKYTDREHKQLAEKFKELEEKHLSERKKRKKYQKLFEEVSTKSFLETDTGKEALGIAKTLGLAFIEKQSSIGALGGGQAAEFNGLSDDKKAFVKEILQNPKLQDASLQNLSMVAVGLSNSEAFIASLGELLTQYELIP